MFLTPYRSREQISSGALTFALAAGCAVVSTDYHYALSGGRHDDRHHGPGGAAARRLYRRQELRSSVHDIETGIQLVVFSGA